MLQLTHAQLQDSIVAINRLLAHDGMTIRLNIALDRLVTAAEPFVVEFQKFRDKIVDKYALRDDDNQVVRPDDDQSQVTIPPEKVAEFGAEMDALLATAVEMAVDGLSVEELERSGVVLSRLEYLALKPLLV